MIASVAAVECPEDFVPFSSGVGVAAHCAPEEGFILGDCTHEPDEAVGDLEAMLHKGTRRSACIGDEPKLVKAGGSRVAMAGYAPECRYADAGSLSDLGLLQAGVGDGGSRTTRGLLSGNEHGAEYGTRRCPRPRDIDIQYAYLLIYSQCC